MEAKLQKALQDDPVVISTLQRLPADAKSVANAVQLWDGGWIKPAKLGSDDLLAPAEQAIVHTVGAAPANCRGDRVFGPRLIMLATGDDTFIISLGSGEWRWGDILASPLPSP